MIVANSDNKPSVRNQSTRTVNRHAAATDFDIRAALHRQHLRHQVLHPGTLVIDELGLAHARSRVDIAVINGCIHGYEIKSAQDSLNRLGAQLAVYRQTLQKLTLVAASRHLPRILSEVPDWCGVIEVVRGPRGGIGLQRIKSAGLNPDIDPVMLAHLIWKPEVLDLLSRIGYKPKELRRPRKDLYEMLCEALTPREITDAIHNFMKCRKGWRDHLVHA